MSERRSTPSTLVLILILLGATAAVFWPVVRHEFLNWDDREMVMLNPGLNHPSWQSVRRFWSEPYMGLYTPLSYTLWTGVAVIAKTATASAEGSNFNPYIFHAVNLALHLTSAVLVFLIVRELLRLFSGTPTREQQWAALLGAMLFAIHPLQVEAVSWVAGMNNLLGGVFSLAAILLYLKGVTRPRFFVAATACFILALLAKPTAVVVPFIIIAIELILLRQRSKRQILLASWFVLAGVMMLITMRVQPAATVWRPGVGQRLLVAADALAFYTTKLLAPVGLVVDYGRSPTWLLTGKALPPLMILTAPLAAIAVILRRRAPWVAAAMMVFAAALLPVLGLVPFDFQRYSTVADRYVYLAMLGPAILLAFVLRDRKSSVAWLAAAAVVVALAATAHAQVWRWRNTFTLFEYNLRQRPDSVTANRILAFTYGQSTRPEDIDTALTFYDKALSLDSTDPSTHYNLANLLMRMGSGVSLQHFQRAINLKPEDPRYHYNYAVALAMANQPDVAEREFRETMKLSPDLPDAHAGLARILLNRGDVDGAIAEFRAALKVDPDLTIAQRGLAEAQAKKK